MLYERCRGRKESILGPREVEETRLNIHLTQGKGSGPFKSVCESKQFPSPAVYFPTRTIS